MENVSRAPLFKRCEAQKPADSPCRCQLARRREYSIRNRFASMPVQNRTGTEVLDEKRNEKSSPRSTPGSLAFFSMGHLRVPYGLQRACAMVWTTFRGDHERSRRIYGSQMGHYPNVGAIDGAAEEASQVEVHCSWCPGRGFRGRWLGVSSGRLVGSASLFSTSLFHVLGPWSRVCNFRQRGCLVEAL